MNTEVVEALELKNLLLQSIASMESAIIRKESRGAAHSRSDYKNRNDNEWLKHALVWVNKDSKLNHAFKKVQLKTNNNNEVKTIAPRAEFIKKK